MLKLQIIVGSTRQGRNADPVMRWILPVIHAHAAFSVEVLDLREWPMPMFQETVAQMGDLRAPTFSDPVVQRWNAKIKEADAFIIVTPEYNHGIPAVLKNAIDSVFFTFGFRHKPVAFVGYSLGPTAAARAVEHLSQVMLETEAMPVRTPTLIPLVSTAFDAHGAPTSPLASIGLTVMLDDLAWLGHALQAARAAGQLPPSAVRIRAVAVAHR